MRITNVIVIAALVAVGGCAREQKPPNVLLITVDTLRPDHLGCYGYGRDTTPTIDALARQGVRCENAYSAAGWTLPAVATIMTGHYPRDHGATDFRWTVSPGLPSIAGELRRRGYDTRGYVSHIILHARYGVADGFKSYDSSVLEVGHPHDVATAEPLTRLALNDIGDLEEPFFLWLHYFDPHFRYLAHGPWTSWGDEDIDRYDQEIAHTDAEISRLMSRLGNKLDNAVVVFTSDHGEEFGEHGNVFHYTLYDEVMRVPLIIKAPSLAPGVDATPVEQVDLMPTLLSLVGIDAGPMPGRDLFAPVGTDERPVFFERDRPPPYNQRGILLGRYKLFVVEMADTMRIPEANRRTFAPVTNVHPGTYMFNLAEDPEEMTNIYDESDPTCRRLFVMLAEHFAAESKPVREVVVDETLAEKLRSLGYLK